ncbi:PIG-L deacetylase family protein [Dokdonella sp. MW10]|uniref:PIG-L deacetylase family protein n=1 Tax=Dokdonella sp. MW10 TaxID=2992926 RepID=UPI003F813D6D
MDGDTWQPPRLDVLPETHWRMLLGRAERVVVVAPHPDDEVLGCGGLLAYASAAGLPIMIVSVTDGEACYPGHAFWTPARLRVARAMELANALSRLGIKRREIVSLHVPDGEVRGMEGQVTAALDTILRHTDLVLTTWQRDGHPDHEAAYRSVSRAACAAGGLVLQFPIWGCPWLATSASDAPIVRLRLDAQVRMHKQQAIACFATQTGEGDARLDRPVLPPPVVERYQMGSEFFLW